MGKLTVRVIELAKRKDRAYCLSDGDGLRVRVATDGTKSWQVKYTVDGKETTVTLPRRYGSNTDAARLSLADARHEAATIRALARSGVDHQQKVKDDLEAQRRQREQEQSEARTVRDLYDAWFPTIATKRGKRGRKDGGSEIVRTFAKFVLSEIGDKTLTQLYATDVRPILTRISDRGANRQATALLVDLKQMFRWGDQNQPWKRLLASSDILAIRAEDIVSGGYDPVRDNERDRVLSEAEIRTLAQLIPKAELSLAIRSAIWIMLSTGTRVGETVAACWKHVDLDKKSWLIPAENAKSGVTHNVRMSDFTHSHFAALWDWRESLPEELRSEFVFPSSRNHLAALNNQTVGKALADRQRPDRKPLPGRTEHTNALLLEGGQWKCHDLRRTCGTLMQSLGIAESIVHRCLNHARADKLDRVYLQHDYADEMTHAWDALGQRLQVLTELTTTPV
ncbi:tyrosine-type recombinase/integrase [Paraburkholderia tropica]|uniref:tyrosine-type recombinase/integrase n=1 Tax=Paraburkholderia tropica TaxID=92647 RepID=UPI00160333E4|nr:site-specific integrase [Paraburkholderia tropica]QNB11817.1 tyrosine-type recombinase/integrase [Paraburkholderia tropica]